ncbi:MAG: 2-phospho-L-lactate transferase [Nitrososphaerales archaeon]|nr:2-phospho-L-lactate transferase [Nitrososphaerales archaeon]
MKVVALAGGTGSAKLLRGLAARTSELKVVANVGDNFWVHGLYVCPDVDIAMYTMAGTADVGRGWGIQGDSFNVLVQLGLLGEETWFNLGDRDLATALLRTELLRKGRSLTEITAGLCRALGVGVPILPATDSPVETHMVTRRGKMHLQEYWVKYGGRPVVEEVEYIGAEKARPTTQVKEAVSGADIVVFCPANPITSIGPILAIKGMKNLLSKSKARKVALSPMAGRAPYSGPAGRLMEALGVRPDSAGVASMYSDFLDEIVIDRRDNGLRQDIEKFGVRCSTTDTFMRSGREERRLASVLLRN